MLSSIFEPSDHLVFEGVVRFKCSEETQRVPALSQGTSAQSLLKSLEKTVTDLHVIVLIESEELKSRIPEEVGLRD